MKDWSDLEDKYQEMREKDSNGAEEFKKKMTERFQRTVQVWTLKYFGRKTRDILAQIIAKLIHLHAYIYESDSL
jgi:hypothetical protein